MVDELISLFKKNDLERRMFIVYILTAIGPAISYFFLSYYLNIWLTIFIYIIVLLFVEVPVIYGFMYFKLKKNMKNDTIKYIKIVKNIAKYNEFERKTKFELVENYLKSKKIYKTDKVLFLINSIKSKRKIKFQRDWVSLIANLTLAVVLGILGKDKFDFFLLEVVFLVIVLLLFLYLVYKFLDWIYQQIMGINSLDKLDMTLSDIYLTMK